MTADDPEFPDDPTLVAHCLAGQETAWQALADRLRRLASGWIAPHPAGSPADVDDLVQEVLTLLPADDRRLRRRHPTTTQPRLSSGL